jgi:signal transduction histidine kinase
MRHHDINQALTRTLFLLESQTLFHNIAIKKDLAPSLPLVLSDIQQLYHLFMNVVLNAVQAMEGRGTLTVKSRLLADVNRVCIEISDTGPGISEEHLPQIFEPFFTTKDEGKGTGLGLSLAYRIVQNHEGHIHAESSPGKGTTFSIELPIGSKHDEGDESGNKT